MEIKSKHTIMKCILQLGLIHTSNLCRVKSIAIESNTSATKMRLGFRRRICVRFNEVLSDTYTRHFFVKLVDTRYLC